jgi:hypothetical protein
MVHWVHYPDGSPRALRRAGGQKWSLDSGQKRYSYVTVGTSVGFSGEIVGLNVTPTFCKNKVFVQIGEHIKMHIKL